MSEPIEEIDQSETPAQDSKDEGGEVDEIQEGVSLDVDAENEEVKKTGEVGSPQEEQPIDIFTSDDNEESNNMSPAVEEGGETVSPQEEQPIDIFTSDDNEESNNMSPAVEEGGETVSPQEEQPIDIFTSDDTEPKDSTPEEQEHVEVEESPSALSDEENSIEEESKVEEPLEDYSSTEDKVPIKDSIEEESQVEEDVGENVEPSPVPPEESEEPLREEDGEEVVDGKSEGKDPSPIKENEFDTHDEIEDVGELENVEEDDGDDEIVPDDEDDPSNIDSILASLDQNESELEQSADMIFDEVDTMTEEGTDEVKSSTVDDTPPEDTPPEEFEEESEMESTDIPEREEVEIEQNSGEEENVDDDDLQRTIDAMKMKQDEMSNKVDEIFSRSTNDDVIDSIVVDEPEEQSVSEILEQAAEDEEEDEEDEEDDPFVFPTPRSARYFRPKDGLLPTPRTERFNEVHRRLTKKYEKYCEHLMLENEKTLLAKKVDVERSENQMKQEVLFSREVQLLQTSLQLEGALQKYQDYKEGLEELMEECGELEEEKDFYEKHMKASKKSHRATLNFENRLDFYLQLLSEIKLQDQKTVTLEKKVKDLTLQKHQRNKVLEKLLTTVNEFRNQHLVEEQRKQERLKIVEVAELNNMYETTMKQSRLQHEQINIMNRKIDEIRGMDNQYSALQGKIAEYNLKIKHLKNLVEGEKRKEALVDERLNHEAVYTNDKQIEMLENEKLYLFTKIQKEVKDMSSTKNSQRHSRNNCNKLLKKFEILHKKLNPIFKKKRKRRYDDSDDESSEEEDEDDGYVPIEDFDGMIQMKRKLKKQNRVLTKKVKKSDGKMEVMDKKLGILTSSKNSKRKKLMLDLNQIINSCEKLHIQKLEREKAYKMKLKRLNTRLTHE